MSVERGPQKSSLVGPRLMALAFIALGIVVLYGAFQIRQGGGYSAVGPNVFPFAVAAGLLVISVIFFLRTTFFPDSELGERAAAEESVTHWPTVAMIIAVLVFYVLSLSILGYVVATTLFFPLAAWVLGSRGALRSTARNVAIGLLLGLIIYFGFTRFLGVRLPAGVLDLIF
jgi:putative tricarboxylic transport membrane protein